MHCSETAVWSPRVGSAKKKILAKTKRLKRQVASELELARPPVGAHRPTATGPAVTELGRGRLRVPRFIFSEGQ